MTAICGIVTVAIFQLILGVGLTGYAAYIVSVLVEVDSNSGNLALIAFPALWISIIAFGVTTLVAGIIGCVAGCQRGQCVVLTYMASCVLCCLSSFVVLIIGALFVVYLCKDGKNCMGDYTGIFWVVVLGCSAFVLLISLIGSGFACRARCHCCSSPQDYEAEHDPNVMVLTSTSPSAPTLSQINSSYK